jgi:hypothetical protein
MAQLQWAPEPAQIDPHEQYQLRYWSERFDVPKDEIEAAIKRVGNRVEDVARELSHHEYV